MNVIVLSGCSGSGKSTYAKKLLEDANGRATCVSADHYFERGGYYDFKSDELPQAHGYCFRRFINALRDGNAGVLDTIIIDNTNQSAANISPYFLGAQAFGWTSELVTVLCDVEVAAARNKHGVPPEKVRQQAARIAKRQVPKTWKQRTVEL
jgi:predicted ABC-type ATPase